MAINFPDNPTDNQEFNGYIYDATRGVWDVKLASDPLGSINLTTPAQGEVLSFDGTNWVNQEIVTNPYSSATSATDFFAIPAGTEVERPVSPANGYIRFNSDIGEPEWYSADLGEWFSFRETPTLNFAVEYLVIAGGGGGASAGAGAGGYRCNVSGELSGGGSPNESELFLSSGTYPVTVGAGGAGGATDSGSPTSGSDSVFASIVSLGGGYGGSAGSADRDGAVGGSGGGYAADSGNVGSGSAGTTGQGFAGGSNGSSAADYPSGGGGGAGSVGAAGSAGVSGNGGLGVSSSITGPLVGRAGGGGGGAYLGGVTPGSGTDGGASASAHSSAGNPGTANTGGGGSGASTAKVGGAGGSGIVIIKYPQSLTATPSAGLTSVTTTIDNYKVTQFTAGTGTVTFS